MLKNTVGGFGPATLKWLGQVWREEDLVAGGGGGGAGAWKMAANVFRLSKLSLPFLEKTYFRTLGYTVDLTVGGTVA